MAPNNSGSQNSLKDATQSRAKFSGHGNALGAAGKRQASFDPDNSEFLRKPGDYFAVTPGPGGFEAIQIGVLWDNVKVEKAGFWSRLLNRAKRAGVDLDIGCLYELQDGTRGAIQAFGEKFGAYDEPPYIRLSGDERTGDKEGFDEYIKVNGQHWKEIKRILVYIYIYSGVANWRELNPKVVIDIPGENDLVVTLRDHEDELDLCAVGGLENIRGGVKLVNYTEYFPGHESMDRAFGFGLDWGDGSKS